jgi:hypothetical protein
MDALLTTAVVTETVMETMETCVICSRDDAKHLGVWFDDKCRRPVHADCWAAAYEAGRLPIDGDRSVA